MKKVLIVLFLWIGLTACGENFSSPAGFGKGLSKTWSTPVNGSGHTAAEGETVVGVTDVGGNTLRLFALNAASKQMLWKTAPYNSTGIGDTYTIYKSRVYNVVPKGNLEVLDLVTGALIETVEPETGTSFRWPAFAAYPTIADDRLFISNGNTLLAYDLSGPGKITLAWKKELGTSLQTGLWASPGSVFVVNKPTTGSNVFAFDTLTGQERWSVRETLDPNTLYAQLTGVRLAGDRLILFANDQSLRMLDPKTGERRWIAQATNDAKCDNGGSIAQAEIAGDMLFLGPPGGACLYGISLADGRIKWTVNSKEFAGATGTFGGKPLYHNGVVYAANGNLWAVDAQTGQVLGISSDVDEGRQFTNPHLINGEIVVWGRSVSGFKPVR